MYESPPSPSPLSPLSIFMWVPIEAVAEGADHFTALSTVLEQIRMERERHNLAFFLAPWNQAL